MQALLAPIAAAAGAGAAAPIGATVAAASTASAAAPLAYLAQGASAVFGGLSAYSAGKAEEEAAKVNSYIGRTRAMQTDTSAPESMNSALGSLRAAFAASGQRPTVGTAEVFNELRRVRGRDRRIEFGNRMQEARGYDTAARNAGMAARHGLWAGLIKAGPSVFDYYDWRKKNMG